MAEFVRAYEIPVFPNEAKIAELRDLLGRWRTGLTTLKQVHVKRLKAGERLRRTTNADWNVYWPGGRPPYLTARQWKSVENQLLQTLKAWQATAKKSGWSIIADLVKQGFVSEREADQLRHMNATHSWWGNSRIGFDQADVELSRELVVTELLRRNPWPVFDRVVTMMFDELICELNKPDEATGFESWLDIVTGPSRGRRVNRLSVPVGHSSYVDAKRLEGVESSVTQVGFDSFGQIQVKRIFRFETSAPRAQGTDIGIDWGLDCMVATSHGQLLGRNLYSWLQDIDAQLTDLTADLQRRGIRPRDARRYRRLNKRIKDHVTNEVGRILNRVADQDIRSVTVESLDFRGGGLSRRLNRILSRAGRAAFRAKLADLQERRGVTVREVNPAYTSQACSSCGFSDRSNRKSSAILKCGHCGRKVHADINAARNIGRRSPDQYAYFTKHSVLADLDQRFVSRWGCTADRIRQRQPRKPSWHARAAGLPVESASNAHRSLVK